MSVKEKQWPRFDTRLWQRSYYEHVVRNEDDLEKIREYIVYNPLKWALDEENPEHKAQGPGTDSVVRADTRRADT